MDLERLAAACRSARQGHLEALEGALSELLGQSVALTVGDATSAPASGRSRRLLDRRGAALSPRLQAVVSLIVDGRSDKEIALALDVQPATARTYVQRLCRALAVSGRGGVLRAALQAGSGAATRSA